MPCMWDLMLCHDSLILCLVIIAYCLTSPLMCLLILMILASCHTRFPLTIPSPTPPSCLSIVTYTLP